MRFYTSSVGKQPLTIELNTMAINRKKQKDAVKTYRILNLLYLF
jgi:hypothetical protein